MGDLFARAGVVPATGCPHYITVKRAATVQTPTRCRGCVMRPHTPRPRDLRADGRGRRGHA